MKMKMRIIIICCLAVSIVTAALISKHSRAVKHEDYLRFVGDRVLCYLGDNNEFPDSLKQLILWDESTMTGGDPNKFIDSWLQKCVCPYTNHKPQSITNIEDWSDVKIVPYLSIQLPGDVMLAYCTADNHRNNLVYAVLWLAQGHNRTFKQNVPVMSISQDTFDRKLEA